MSDNCFERPEGTAQKTIDITATIGRPFSSLTSCWCATGATAAASTATSGGRGNAACATAWATSHAASGTPGWPAFRRSPGAYPQPTYADCLSSLVSHAKLQGRSVAPLAQPVASLAPAGGSPCQASSIRSQATTAPSGICGTRCANAFIKNFSICSSPGRSPSQNGLTIVEGRGAHINLRNLLLGGSDKGEGQRGRFGEGTKLGWLVLFAKACPSSSLQGEFHGLHARWTDMFGEQVMEVCWDEGEFFDGSRYELHYTGELWEERVMRPGDPRILFEDALGRMILDEGPSRSSTSRACGLARPGRMAPTAPSATTSRICPWPRTARSRTPGKRRGALAGCGPAYRTKSCSARFWHAVEDGRAEASANMSGAQIEAPKAHKRAMQQAFGSRVVVATDADTQREAEYRGLKPVRFEWGLQAAAKEIVGTDREELAAVAGAAFTQYPKSRLSDGQRKILDMLLRLAGRAGMNREVHPYMLPPNVAGPGDGRQDRPGCVGVRRCAEGDRRLAARGSAHRAQHRRRHRCARRRRGQRGGQGDRQLCAEVSTI